MMYEYAITAGEGTLVEFGVFDSWISPVDDLLDGMVDGETLIIAPCDDDCETGK